MKQRVWDVLQLCCGNCSTVGGSRNILLTDAKASVDVHRVSESSLSAFSSQSVTYPKKCCTIPSSPLFFGEAVTTFTLQLFPETSHKNLLKFKRHVYKLQ